MKTKQINIDRLIDHKPDYDQEFYVEMINRLQKGMNIKIPRDLVFASEIIKSDKYHPVLEKAQFLLKSPILIDDASSSKIRRTLLESPMNSIYFSYDDLLQTFLVNQDPDFLTLHVVLYKKGKKRLFYEQEEKIFASYPEFLDYVQNTSLVIYDDEFDALKFNFHKKMSLINRQVFEIDIPY